MFKIKFRKRNLFFKYKKSFLKKTFKKCNFSTIINLSFYKIYENQIPFKLNRFSVFLFLFLFFMFIKIFPSICSSSRFKEIVGASLSSTKIIKNLKFQFFKKRIYNNHNSVGKSNSILKLNINKFFFFGTYTIFNYIKVRYSNKFFGFCEFFDGSICIRPLSYGFSYIDIYYDSFFKHMIMQYMFSEKKELDRKERKNGICELDANEMQFINLLDVPINFFFYYISNFFKKFFYSTSAGSFSTIIEIDFEKKTALLVLPSKKIIYLNELHTCYLGRSSNIYLNESIFGSFSLKNKIKNSFCKVRGIAKNPVDHPNGGRSKIKQPFLNPWGKIAKNGK